MTRLIQMGRRLKERIFLRINALRKGDTSILVLVGIVIGVAFLLISVLFGKNVYGAVWEKVQSMFSEVSPMGGIN